jgi:hypothetical protein
VAQVFNLCTRTGKMPVPPKTFQVNEQLWKTIISTFPCTLT